MRAGSCATLPLTSFDNGHKRMPNHALHRTAAQRVSGQLEHAGGAAVGELFVMRRPRLQSVLAWAIIAAAVLWSIYDWIFVDEGLRYFTADRSRVLVLLAIVIVGTPILLGYEALSAERRRRVALWVVGILAASATGLALHFVYSMARLAGFLHETGGLWLGLVGTLFPCMIAVCLWWAFSRIRHRKPV